MPTAPTSFLNGEWVRIRNLDPVNEVHLGGWWLRDSALSRYVFPDWATLPPGESLTVYVGEGTDTWTEFFWNRRKRLVREPDRRRARTGRRRLPVRSAGRPARVDDLSVPRARAPTPTRARVEVTAKPRGRES